MFPPDRSMNKSPLFSVLIANYNNGRFLQEAIDSVLGQTFPDWEVIIVDDASTDDSPSIYEKYASDGRFRIYRNEKNSGCGFTKRKCIKLAEGELCGFLDSDDALMPNALEVMVGAHAEHPECSLIYSTCYRYSGDKDADMPIWDFIGPIPEASDFLIFRKRLVSHFVSFKKAYYNRTVGIDRTLLCAEDRDLYYKLEEVGKLLHLPVPLYYYRVNNVNSVSIGTEEKDIRAHHYSVCAELNAICRRMGGPLYKRNKKAYLEYMRVLLKVYYHSTLYRRSAFMRYCWFYLRGYAFSPHACSHLLKIVRGV